jgi:hypothetical protein
MTKWLSKRIDNLSNYLAVRKGLLPLLGIALVAANFLLQFLPASWLGQSDLLLHLGVVLAIFGLLLAIVL